MTREIGLGTGKHSQSQQMPVEGVGERVEGGGEGVKAGGGGVVQGAERPTLPAPGLELKEAPLIKGGETEVPWAVLSAGEVGILLALPIVGFELKMAGVGV